MPSNAPTHRLGRRLLARSLIAFLCGATALLSGCSESPTTPEGLYPSDRIAAATRGNSAQTAACQGVWGILFTSTGKPFASQGACVSYVKKGGVLSRAQTITFTSANPSPVTVGATYRPTALASSGLPVTFTVDGASSGCALTNGVVSSASAGTCLVNANQPGEPGWLAAAQVQQSISFFGPSDIQPPLFAGLAVATALNANTIVLTWSAGSDNVTASGNLVYRIYRAIGSAPTVFTSPTLVSSPGATSVVVGGLAPNTTYFFVVRAVDEAGNEDVNVVPRSATTPSV